MVRDAKRGMTELVMKECGSITRRTARGPFGTRMGIDTKGTGLMIKPKVMGCILMLTELSIKASGKRIYRTVGALKSG
jgi:hypothetical protein